MVLPIAAQETAEMLPPELLESIVAVVVAVQVDQEMQQVQQVAMALCLSPLIFFRALLTTTMVQQAEYRRCLSILKQF
jgi:hypothetical protein